MSMAYVAVAVAVIAAATSAYATYSAGENAKEVGEYNKKVADNAALDAAQRGSIEAADHRQKVRQMISRQNASFSAGGLDASTGTPLEIMTETAGMGELDALRIVNNAQRQGAGLKAQGELEMFKGNAAYRGGMLTAGGTLLGGASNAYYGGKQSGLWGGSK